MMRNLIQPIARASNVNLVLRPFASASSAKDPIQQLFVDKIREYRQKSANAPNGLVDADASTQKALEEEAIRLKRNFNINDGEETVITAKFAKDCHIDSPNMKEWK